MVFEQKNVIMKVNMDFNYLLAQRIKGRGTTYNLFCIHSVSLKTLWRHNLIALTWIDFELILLASTRTPDRMWWILLSSCAQYIHCYQCSKYLYKYSGFHENGMSSLFAIISNIVYGISNSSTSIHMNTEQINFINLEKQILNYKIHM